MKRTLLHTIIGLVYFLAAVSINFSMLADVVENTSTSPVPLKRIDVPFPWVATSEISGYTEALIEVNNEGIVGDIVILKSTHRAFSLAVINTVSKTEFQPAVKDGQPVAARLIIKNHFISDRHVTVRKIGEKTRPYWVDERTVKSLVFGPLDLDQPLVRIETTAPIYPEDLMQTNLAGGVLIEFFIDEKGSVRAPTIISSSHEAFSESALEAIRLWKFSPPKSRGDPVTVRARQQLNF
ncbi:MAG: energy transducer TonB [Verrucomicrobia bacterium]|nr:energy transducer TonB [Verrucomicrobiota bacterium]